MAAKSILFDNRVRVPADVFNLASFRRWMTSDDFPEEGRISFLDGQLEIDMNAEDISAHSDPQGSLTVALWALAEKYDLGRVFVDGVRLVNEVVGISHEPDVMFCRWTTMESGTVQLMENNPGTKKHTELVGTPDLVVEIVSDSSVRKDTRILKKKYFPADIEEYWLIDARKAEITFQVLTRGERGYEPVPADRQGCIKSFIFPTKFKLTREQDRIGNPRYRLLHRDST